MIAHPRKGYDENRIPGKLDIRGSACISDLADNTFVIFRGKNAFGNQPNCIWRCDKQRHGKREGEIKLYFDPETYQFLESPNAEPYPIVY